MCVFCKIINKEFKSSIVYEDEDTLAILDLSQQTYGHTLVMPKKHFSNMIDIDINTLNKVLNTVKIVTEKLKNKLDAKGFNYVNNCNEIAGQTVMHFHIHVIPRYENDDSKLVFINNKSSINIEDANNKDKYNLNEILNKLNN